MNLKYLSALLVLAAGPVGAQDFAANESPQIFSKAYEAMHYAERPYEIGRSSITLSVNCLDNQAAVEKAIGDKQAKIEQLVDTAAKGLNLGEPGETYGHKYDNKIGSYAVSPIVQPNQFNGFRWENICTGVKSDVPVRAKNVFAGSKEVTFWFPNKGAILNNLTALVTEIEKLSEESTSGVKVKCNSAGGTNYDLAVSEKTEAGAWKEVEAVAKAAARKKVAEDFAKIQYDSIWKGKEYFAQNAQTRLPTPNVVKEGGRWVAKFSDYRNYTVYVKQATTAEARQHGKLADTRNYGVTAEAESTEGLYGTVTITVTKGCEETQAKAEAAVAAAGNPILADLRNINKGKNTTTDRLKAYDASGTEASPWVVYRSMYNPDGTVLNHYYNNCTLETKQGAVPPKGTVWNGNMTLVISSSDLDALTKIRDDVKAKHKVEVVDPTQLAVNVDWKATAILSVLENLASQLETNSFERFMDEKSEFRCEAGNLSFACISQPNHNVTRSFQKNRSMEDASPAAAPGGAYTEGVTSNIDANERGAATFRGKYVINYTLRKVLVNNEGPKHSTRLP